MPLFRLQYAVLPPYSQLEFVDRLFGTRHALYILIDK